MTQPLSQKLLNNPGALCNMLKRIAIEAGEITLEYYDDSGYYGADEKGDGSPVTAADRAAEAHIVKAISGILDDIPIIGEELYSEGRAPELNGADYFVLVDALDGTKEFIAGGEEYTVNIAIIRNGAPFMGVVYLPVKGELFSGYGPGTALRWTDEAEKDRPIHVREQTSKGLVVVSSKSHGSASEMNEFLQDYKIAKVIKKGSSAKICAVASGKADLYPRFGPTCEWDIAAGDAILRSAGGAIYDMDGQPMIYGKEAGKYLNPNFVAAIEGFWDFSD